MMARSPLDDLTDAAKDLTYVCVGFSVLAFQRLQVRRQELAKELAERDGDGSGPLEVAASLVLGSLDVVEERIGALLGDS
jgi:hypothetical protein